VKERALKANVERPPLHAFRRAFALNMLRNGCDLLTLQRLMGHADLSLLQRYAEQTTDDLRQVHAGAEASRDLHSKILETLLRRYTDMLTLRGFL
jgi:site-specific recombinase XerD